jgi:phosphoribosyl 1,2-cyclic phosphodiesterase
MLQIKFYGTRGSISVSGKEYEEFGGNTTCIQIMTKDTRRIGILDAGTGIRKLGNDFLAMATGQKDIFIAFSHFHWDHIQGFPFFAPAYDKSKVINILAPGEDRKLEDLKDIFDVQMQARYFPVAMNEMGATFNFLPIERNMAVFTPADNIPVKVTAVRHNHPGGAYSYRYERQGIAVMVSMDIEHGDMIDENIVELARGVDLLIHDAQYTAEERASKKAGGTAVMTRRWKLPEERPLSDWL